MCVWGVRGVGAKVLTFVASDVDSSHVVCNIALHDSKDAIDHSNLLAACCLRDLVWKGSRELSRFFAWCHVMHSNIFKRARWQT